MKRRLPRWRKSRDRALLPIRQSDTPLVAHAGVARCCLGKCEMNDNAALRQQIRSILNGARAKVHDYTGLYADEDLTSEVLRVCDSVTEVVASGPSLGQARLIVED